MFPLEMLGRMSVLIDTHLGSSWYDGFVNWDEWAGEGLLYAILLPNRLEQTIASLINDKTFDSLSIEKMVAKLGKEFVLDENEQLHTIVKFGKTLRLKTRLGEYLNNLKHASKLLELLGVNFVGIAHVKNTFLAEKDLKYRAEKVFKFKPIVSSSNTKTEYFEAQNSGLTTRKIVAKAFRSIVANMEWLVDGDVRVNEEYNRHMTYRRQNGCKALGIDYAHNFKFNLFWD